MQPSSRASTYHTDIAKLITALIKVRHKGGWIQATPPQYPWLYEVDRRRHNPPGPLASPVHGEGLVVAQKILKLLRAEDFRGTNAMYRPLIERLVIIEDLQAAVDVYVSLVEDWNLSELQKMEEGPEKADRLARMERCSAMIAAGRTNAKKLDGTLSANSGRHALEPLDDLLEPILREVTRRFRKVEEWGRMAKVPRKGYKTPKPLVIHPWQPRDAIPALNPTDDPGLFWALEACRCLSTLLYYRQLPSTQFFSLYPLLNTLSQLPETPKYAIDVVLPPSADYDYHSVPRWQRDVSWSSFRNPDPDSSQTPFTFRTSLFSFVRTLLGVMSRGQRNTRLAKELLPIPGKELVPILDGSSQLTEGANREASR